MREMNWYKIQESNQVLKPIAFFSTQWMPWRKAFTDQADRLIETIFPSRWTKVKDDSLMGYFYDVSGVGFFEVLPDFDHEETV